MSELLDAIGLSRLAVKCGAVEDNEAILVPIYNNKVSRPIPIVQALIVEWVWRTELLQTSFCIEIVVVMSRVYIVIARGHEDITRTKCRFDSLDEAPAMIHRRWFSPVAKVARTDEYIGS